MNFGTRLRDYQRKRRGKASGLPQEAVSPPDLTPEPSNGSEAPGEAPAKPCTHGTIRIMCLDCEEHRQQCKHQRMVLVCAECGAAPSVTFPEPAK
jgi:hypothetical protein